ncbi:hypothetical protein ACFLWC_07775 [Chloroflexota bacterium]
MCAKYDRDYIARHEQIWNKLIETAEKSNRGCIEVSKIAAELKMDQRTVRAHLRIIEVDNAGVFIDPEGKQFCTKEGIALLASRLGLKELATEKETESKDQSV